jgi:lactate permease
MRTSPFACSIMAWRGASAWVWTQRYDPFDDWRLSTAAAAVPVLVLLVLLAVGRVSAWKAALTALLSACCVAWLVFKMPAPMVLSSVTVGLVFALVRIVWLIVAAVFLYEITVATGQFEIMKASVARLSPDRRLQAVLVAFCFGAFIEGAAGFGAPVAISAAFLVGLGFDPFKAALLCLIANTAPVAWGSIGIPIRTLATVTGLDVESLSATSGRILPFLSLIIPFWLVRVMSSWRETLAVWFPLAIIGGAFASVQFLWSNFVGFELVDIVASVASMAAGVVAIHLWKPRETWRFEGDPEHPATEPASHGVTDAAAVGKTALGPLSAGRIVRAWLPYGLLVITVMLWGLPPVKSLGTPAVKEWLDARFSWKPALPSLHLLVAKGEAVTGHETALPEDREKAQLDIVPLSCTGTAVFLAAVISGWLLGQSPRAMARLLWGVLRRMTPALAAIFCMLALGFVTKYSGMDAVLGLAFTRSGPLIYPIFGTLLGWLGVALTGSDTSSNVLFGDLQKITAIKLKLNPILMASANTTGGVMGKMIDAQSIVVATAATGEGGREGELLRAVFWHSIVLALIVGAIVWVYAHLLPGMVVGSAAP